MQQKALSTPVVIGIIAVVLVVLAIIGYRAVAPSPEGAMTLEQMQQRSGGGSRTPAGGPGGAAR
jgi:hypothetical protein